MTKTKPSSSALGCLQKIVDALNSEGSSLTATTLKRYHGCDSEYFEEAVEFGNKSKILKWGSHNKFTLIDTDWKLPESYYYDACMEAVQVLWKQFGFEKTEFYVELTASTDSKIAGPWTRPDITLVSHKKFSWTIGQEFDVVTFEIKRPQTSNVLAVFEALSHASAATKAYVVFPLSETQWKEQFPQQAPRVIEECANHGVGLIFIDDPLGNALAIHHLPARRRQIDHEKCSSFLDAVLKDSGKQLISKWK